MNPMSRPYRQKQRAEAQAETRERIVDAAIALHEAKGVAATSMADIAARAGVGKVTVYRHFGDEAAILGACSSTYFQSHPFPEVEAWRDIASPAERLRQGFAETYAYHRETEAMMSSVLPELGDSPLVEPYRAHWRHAVEVLAGAWPQSARSPELAAAIALALRFDTWALLVREHGLNDAQAVGLMLQLAVPPGAGC